MIWLDIFSVFCFVTCWYGYSRFARSRAKRSDCIARCLHQHRIHWMQEYIKKELRMTDAALIGNLERSIAFFASSSLLVLAGVITLFAQIEFVQKVVSAVPFSTQAPQFLIQTKILVLALIFVIGFFNFTWSMRQYGFVTVMMGAAPYESGKMDKDLKAYALQMAKVQDQAAHSYNYGLRAFYFSLAAVCWLVHPLLLIITSLIVVFTLYKREFNSKAVKAITEGQRILNERD